VDVFPKVIAVVLNWCNESETSACLESLAASRYDELTVLLVDNGSPDGSGGALHARFPDTPYLQTGANLGYAGGNNRGFAWALEHDAQYVLVLNNDTVVDPDCVSRLVQAANDTGAPVVAPQIRHFDEPERIWYGGGSFSLMRALGMHETNGHGDRRRPVTFVCGCCFLIRADVLRTVGGFDESYFAYGEDAELSLRLSRAGYDLLYEPAARLLHRIEHDAPSTPFQIRQRDRNRRRLVARHYTAAGRVRFALWFYPSRLAHLARYLARANWASARAIVDGAFGRIPSSPATIE
jgi:GT2 family glycosyltransferase